jgi:hypothetical protein
MRYEKPSQFLEDLDSHSVYDAKMLDECEFDVSTVPVQTRHGVAQEMNERGLGGWLKEDGVSILFSGWKAADALALKYLGYDPAPMIQGRGSRFRACLSALKEAGH